MTSDVISVEVIEEVRKPTNHDFVIRPTLVHFAKQALAVKTVESDADLVLDVVFEGLTVSSIQRFRMVHWRLLRAHVVDYRVGLHVFIGGERVDARLAF